MELIIIIIGGAVVLIGAYTALYNGLVAARQKVKEGWSGIDVQLKRRYDLIPNLIKTVRGYAEHEKSLLENVTKARTQAISNPDNNVAGQAQAEGLLSSALKSVFAVAENYPDLKASQNFVKLQEDLTETEDQIAAARRIYNGNVTHLNVKVESFPSNIVAGMHHFEKSEFFEMDDIELAAAQKAPEVEF